MPRISSFLKWNSIGAYETQNDLPKAIEPLQEGLQAAPHDPELMTTLGWLDIKAGNLSEAEKQFTAALAILRSPSGKMTGTSYVGG